MTPMPSWLTNVILVLGPLSLLIALFFGVPADATGETASLLTTFLQNAWEVGVALVMGAKGIYDSVKRWKNDGSEPLKKLFGLS